LERPLRFILTPGQTGDITQAPTLLEGRRAGHAISGIGAIAMIRINPTRKHPFTHDPVIYKLRNRIERCPNKLKHFRRFATRYDRRAIHFLSFIHLAAAMLWIRSMSIQLRATDTASPTDQSVTSCCSSGQSIDIINKYWSALIYKIIILTRFKAHRMVNGSGMSRRTGGLG